MEAHTNIGNKTALITINVKLKGPEKNESKESMGDISALQQPITREIISCTSRKQI